MDPTTSELRQIAGLRLIGSLLNATLYGSLEAQVVFYYRAFPKDKYFIKYAVCAIFLLETTQTVMIFYDCFEIFTTGLTDPSKVNNQEYGWFDVIILNGITTCIVQNLFSYRLFLFSKSAIFPVMISTISLAQSVGSIVGGIKARQTTLTRTGKASSLPICIWLIGSATCDILLALSTTYYLSSSNPQFRRTKTLINKLIRMTMGMGSLTASIAIVYAVLILIDTPKSIAGTIIPSLVLSKLSSNTTLVLLNSRRNLRTSGESLRSRQASVIDFGLPNLEVDDFPETNPT